MADDIDTLYKEITGNSNKKSVVSSTGDVTALYNEIIGNKPDVTTLPENIQKFPELKTVPVQKSIQENVGAGAVKGIEDVAATAGLGAGFVDASLFPGGDVRNRLYKEFVDKKNKQFESQYGDSLAANVGRVGGQVAATAPLVPARALNAVDAATGAAPVVAAGVKEVAPLINRMGASVVKGGIGGGTFGLGTASTTEKKDWGVVKNPITEGIITGALTGPMIVAAGEAVRSPKVISSLWANIDMNKLARDADLPLSSVKNMIERLKDVGLSPQLAQAELNKLGPKATLMDLDRALTTEGSGLASIGGKPTSLLKGRMDARAETANSDAVKLFENKFGPKPDLEAEKEAVHKTAQKLTSADYKAAHANTTPLDIKNVVDDIDKSLKTAVGEKASLLKEIKGYLFKDVKDPTTGETSKVLKNDVASLHEVRIELDSILNKGGTPETSAGKNALGAIENVRNKVDEALKTIPEMQAADEKFAKHMDVKSGLDFGYNVIAKSNINKEEFKRAFDSFEPEVKQAVKKGMHAAALDIAEKSGQGELTGVERVFGKKAVNRANFTHAFGSDADEVLEGLHREMVFKGTERAVGQGSQTAERQAVQRRYGERNDKGGGPISEGIKGAVIDFATGSPAIATTIMASKRAATGIGVKYSESRLGQLIEGTSDIISRSGPSRDAAMSVLERVSRIQDNMNGPSILKRIDANKLPSTLAAPVGEESYSKMRNYLRY